MKRYLYTIGLAAILSCSEQQAPLLLHTPQQEVVIKRNYSVLETFLDADPSLSEEKDKARIVAYDIIDRASTYLSKEGIPSDYEIVKATSKALQEEGMSIANELFSKGLQTHRLTTLQASAIYKQVSDLFGGQLEIVTTPKGSYVKHQHDRFILYLDPKHQTRWNEKALQSRDDISSTDIEIGLYLQPLDSSELRAYAHAENATVYSLRASPESIRELEKALAIYEHPNFEREYISEQKKFRETMNPLLRPFFQDSL